MATDLNAVRGDVFPNFDQARRKKRKRSRGPLPSPARIEPLEARRLLASAGISGGVLTYTGDSVAEKVQVYRLTGPGQDDIHIRVAATDYGPFASSAITSRIELNLAGGNDQAVVETSADISNGTTPFGDAKLGTVAVQKVTKLLGSTGDDTMYGSDQADTMNGGDGNDFLYGRAGGDTMYGYAGADYFEGGTGGELMYGSDAFNSFDGNDTMWAEEGNDTLFGEGGDDVLRCGSDNDAAYGGDGADSLFAGGGTAYLAGEAGNDWFDARDGGGVTSVIGGSGTDAIGGRYEVGTDVLLDTLEA